MIIHPLYVELQRKSPMGQIHSHTKGHSRYDVLVEYNITEVDTAKNPISRKQFYRNHVAKSLPLILRNDCQNWRLKEKLDETDSNQKE